MADFTKGTWIHNPETAIISAHTLSANGKDSEHPVAVALGAVARNPIIDNTEALANARLIENAPAMFALLQRIQPELGKDDELYWPIEALLSKIRLGEEGIENEPRKPCPFCGCENSTLIQFVPEEEFCIECALCECSTRLCDTKDEAVDAWNRREADDDE